MNIVELFEKARLLGDKEFAILENEEKISYAEVLLSANKLSNFFFDLGLVEEDNIVLSSKSKKVIAIISIAAYRYGLSVVLIDNHSKKERVKSILDSSCPKISIIDEELVDNWDLANYKHLVIKPEEKQKSSTFKKLFSKPPAKPEMEESTISYPTCLNKYAGFEPKFPEIINENSIAYILYTSGSTSEPKGVMITYGNLFSHLETLQKVYQMNASTRILNVLNLFHSDGINQGPMLAFYCGATWVSPFKLDTTQLDNFYYSIYKYSITHAFVVPTLLAFFEKLHTGYEDSFHTADFKFLISVAAQLNERLWQSVMDIFKVRIVNVYGLTETVTGSLYCGPDDALFKVGTIGKPIDCELKIINDAGVELGENAAGELLIKGSHVMKGYYNNAQATTEVIQQGWLYTGDIAIKDFEGFYKIIGRKKSMINSGGFRIQPEEIEEVLMRMPEIEFCKVIGVEDSILIEKMLAFVQLKDHQSMDETDCFKFLRSNLEPEKIPSQIYFVSDFERGLSGKIMIDPIKKLVSQNQFSDVNKFGSNLETIIQIAAQTFKVKKEEITALSSSSNLAGWDSLNNFIFITGLEEQFKIQFTTAEIMSMKNIQNIDTILSKKLSNA